MITLNQANIIGNVGTPPELRFTPTGKPVTNFTVASNNRWKTPEGETKEETDWFSVVVWGKLAEICNQYLAKGHTVYVSGRVTLHKWIKKEDNTEHARLELQANKVIFLTKSEGQDSVVDTEPPEGMPF